MLREWLRALRAETQSALCIGLDPDLVRLPVGLRESRTGIFDFNRAIIDATADLVCANKPQIAYYSAWAAEDQLATTIRYIREHHPRVLVILDAKRGDIGPTAEMYAREAFARYEADAVTVNPYMGFDAVEPFVSRKDRGVFVLCRTSNPSGRVVSRFGASRNSALSARGRRSCVALEPLRQRRASSWGDLSRTDAPLARNGWRHALFVARRR